MAMKQPIRPDAALLRRVAEAKLSSAASPVPADPASTSELLHELQVHQAELELQNEELRRTQFQLEEARDRYLDLYDFAPVGYFTVDPEGRISSINLTGAVLLGMDRAELLNRPFSRFVVPELQARWASYLALAREEEAPPALELRLRPNGRDPFPAQISSSRTTVGPGCRPEVRCALQDVSERRRSEAERDQRMAELLSLNERLRRSQDQLLQAGKLAAIGQLAAGVAHEVNNPLAYVKTNVHEAGELSARAMEVIQEATNAARSCSATCPVLQRLREAHDLDALQLDLAEVFGESRQGLDQVSRILNDLRSFAHPDDGRRDEASLHRLLDRALRVTASAMAGRVQVVRAYGADDPPIWCRPQQLEQVFVNVLANAAQAIERNGTITLTTGLAGPEAWVEVSDTGRGISREHLQRLFEPFFTTKPVGEGTGLGLSIAHGIVRTHGGRIDVRSEVGVGSTFRIFLPLGRRDAAPTPTTTAGDAEPGRYGV